MSKQKSPTKVTWNRTAATAYHAAGSLVVEFDHQARAWRWTIWRGGALRDHGRSLSEQGARRAVRLRADGLATFDARRASDTGTEGGGR